MINSIDQNLPCPSCQRQYPLKSCHHIMNFTTMEIRFTCIYCHRVIRTFSFQRWNQLHQRAELSEIQETRTQPRSRNFKRSRFRTPSRVAVKKVKKEIIEKKAGKPSETEKERQTNLDRVYQRNVPD